VPTLVRRSSESSVPAPAARGTPVALQRRVPEPTRRNSITSCDADVAVATKVRIGRRTSLLGVPSVV